MSRRRSRSLRSTLARWLAGAFSLLLVLSLAALGYLSWSYPDKAGPGAGQEVVVDIPWGGGPAAVARLLSEAGVVEDPRLFAWFLRIRGVAGGLAAGRHRLRDDWSPARLAEELVRPGLGAQTRVTLREGLSRFEVGAELERRGVCARDAFLLVTEDEDLRRRFGIVGPSAEGYLFPETYQMAPGTAPAEVVERLLRTFERRVGPALEQHREELAQLGRDMLALQQELGRGPFDQEGLDPFSVGRHAAVIIASLVEAETPVPAERPQVAAVALNRLRSPEFPFRRLQFDPTVRYGCLAEPARAPSCQGGVEVLTTRQLEDGENRYNTYTYPGLPPGPIGNPSLSSISAVLEPAAVDFLYFVASGTGGHVFSRTLAEHNAAVARYRASRSRDAGPDAER